MWSWRESKDGGCMLSKIFCFLLLVPFEVEFAFKTALLLEANIYLKQENMSVKEPWTKSICDLLVMWFQTTFYKHFRRDAFKRLGLQPERKSWGCIDLICLCRPTKANRKGLEKTHHLLASHIDYTWELLTIYVVQV